jgi:DNA-binding protein HU-beta
LNKSDLIEVVASQTGAPQKTVLEVIDATVVAMASAIASGHKVTVTGFGSFFATKRSVRVMRNPKTGKESVIPAGLIPRFKPGAGFRGLVFRLAQSSAGN